MAATDLGAIRTKVRRLTRSPSPAQLSDLQIDDYVNTFFLYDMPEELRIFDLRTTFTFYTQPYIDVYKTNTTDATDPLFDFKNKYITIHPPVYVAGYEVFFSQSRTQFFGIYPFLNSIATISLSGDGTTQTFTGNVLNTSGPTMASSTGTLVLRNNVLFSSINTLGNGLAMVDYPISATTGNLVPPTNSFPPSTTPLDPNNNINYTTGVFTVTFQTAPAAGQAIDNQCVLVQPARPIAMLYYDDQFTMRPVPDQPYAVNMETYIRPTQLIQAGDNPQILQWWQYLAYGAARKVFDDRGDTESIEQILPEFIRQERLVLRKTLIQYTNERVATIYTEQAGLNGGSGYGWGYGGGQF